MEVRLFRLITLVWGCVVLCAVVPINFLWVVAEYRGATSAALVAFSVVSLWAWHESGAGRLWVRTVFAVSLVALDLMWFLGGGSTGATVVFNFCLLILPVVFLEGSSRVVSSGFLAANLAALYVLEYVHPEWVVRHATHADRMMDITATALVGLLGVGLSLAVVVRGYRTEQERLARALAEVRTLRGLLPICAWCKRIRSDDGRWHEMATYLGEHTDAQATHGMCPECGERFASDAARFERGQTTGGRG